jgi:hypothetical protein
MNDKQEQSEQKIDWINTVLPLTLAVILFTILILTN